MCISHSRRFLPEIAKNSALQDKFNEWGTEQQEEFLNICTGVKGLKLLYDGFFKEIMNPEYAPERLDDFLSHILCQRVRVVKVLPNDSVRLADESSMPTLTHVITFSNRNPIRD